MKQNEITVTFHPEMVRAMFDCGKTQTARLNILGNIGDTFGLTHPDTQEKGSWTIIEITEHPLWYVAMHMHKKEGFVSETDFMRFWKKLYPKTKHSDTTVFVHTVKPDGVKHG